jgi:hypothetical protein
MVLINLIFRNHCTCFSKLENTLRNNYWILVAKIKSACLHYTSKVNRHYSLVMDANSQKRLGRKECSIIGCPAP